MHINIVTAKLIRGIIYNLDNKNMSHCDTLLWCVCFPLFPETNDNNELLSQCDIIVLFSSNSKGDSAREW